MSRTRWLSRREGIAKRNPHRMERSPRVVFRPTIEKLEDRTLLDGGLGFSLPDQFLLTTLDDDARLRLFGDGFVPGGLEWEIVSSQDPIRSPFQDAGGEPSGRSGGGSGLLPPGPGGASGLDPGLPGTFAVTRAEYTFGDTAFTPPGFPGPVEVTASVHFPSDLSGGPFPLLVFLHGRHGTCFKGHTAFLEWPCAQGRSPIPSYQGYDYISQTLASHGYIIVSISANGINARDNSVFDLGMLARAQLIQHHLDIWNDFNSSGGAPFGTLFVGKVDLQNVGTMGHSRGGEGVVRHFGYNQSLGSPYDIDAVFPLAPVDFSRPVINNVEQAVLLPYCDGDVSDLQGVHFYDDARYNVPGDLSRKHTILVMGANHNFYNTIWTPGLFPAGTADDWFAFVRGGRSDPHCGRVPGNHRLSDAQQRGTGLAYISAFFRTYIGGETQFLPVLQGDAPAPPSAQTNELFVSYHAPDSAVFRRDVNRLLDAGNLTVNTLGGLVTQNGLTPYELCGGEAPQPRFCLPAQPNARQPHTTPSARASEKRGLSQLKFGWDSPTAFWQNDLPAGSRDVSGYAVLQFRATVNFEDARNLPGQAQDFSVRLTDGAGTSATTKVSNWSQALFFPPGGPRVTPLPKIVLNTIRIPLSAFAGITLTDVQAIRFMFDQRPSGALLVSDLAFADPAAIGMATQSGTFAFLFSAAGMLTSNGPSAPVAESTAQVPPLDNAGVDGYFRLLANADWKLLDLGSRDLASQPHRDDFAEFAPFDAGVTIGLLGL